MDRAGLDGGAVEHRAQQLMQPCDLNWHGSTYTAVPIVGTSTPAYVVRHGKFPYSGGSVQSGLDLNRTSNLEK